MASASVEVHLPNSCASHSNNHTLCQPSLNSGGVVGIGSRPTSRSGDHSKWNPVYEQVDLESDIRLPSLVPLSSCCDTFRTASFNDKALGECVHEQGTTSDLGNV